MYFVKDKKNGFTAIEVLVAIGIFSFFGVALFYVYQQIMNSYRASIWKQEKAAQGEIFWQYLRKNLEEASNKNEIVDDGTDLRINVNPKPLIYRSVPEDTPENLKDGTILAWTRNHNNNLGIIEYELSCKLVLQNRDLRLIVKPINGRAPPGEEIDKIVFSDVEGVVINCIPVFQSQEKGEYISQSGGSGDQEVGTVVEISVILRPPKGFPIKNLKITQNNKFKIGVNSDDRAISESNFGYSNQN